LVHAAYDYVPRHGSVSNADSYERASETHQAILIGPVLDQSDTVQTELGLPEYRADSAITLAGTQPNDAPALLFGDPDPMVSQTSDPAFHQGDAARPLVGLAKSVWVKAYAVLSPVPWQRLVLAAWVTGSLSLLLLRFKQFLCMFEVVNHAEAASSTVQALGRDVAQRLDVPRMPQIRVVHRAISPSVCALGRSTIVLPVKLVKECETDVIRTVLAHELAHLKRRDHWVCWIELVSSLVYWWHPVFWLVRSQVRRAADEAADAGAVLAVGGRKRYAESLLQTVELLVADRTVAAAWGPALGERDTIARRLTMIMKGPLRSRLSWPGWLGIALVGLAVLPAAPQSLSAQDERAVPAPPVGLPTGEEPKAVLNLLSEGVPVAGAPAPEP
jgi:beta-lactamase regulating signal transducer with metallopeptidase domain